MKLKWYRAIEKKTGKHNSPKNREMQKIQNRLRLEFCEFSHLFKMEDKEYQKKKVSFYDFEFIQNTQILKILFEQVIEITIHVLNLKSIVFPSNTNKQI